MNVLFQQEMLETHLSTWHSEAPIRDTDKLALEIINSSMNKQTQPTGSAS